MVSERAFNQNYCGSLGKVLLHLGHIWVLKQRSAFLERKFCHVLEVIYSHFEVYALLWPPYVIGQDIILYIIFLPCGLFLSYSSFFSLPNFSRRRLDVYNTSTHGLALV